MPYIQMPPLIRAGEATQEGIQGVQNAMTTRSNLDTAKLQQNRMGMMNQDMAREQQNRAELEQLLMSTPEPERKRAGLEFLKVRDPEKAAHLSAKYIEEFIGKAKIDPKGAAAELENATGEKVEIGKRYVKLAFGSGDRYIDTLTGQEAVVNDAESLARVRADMTRENAIALEKVRSENREGLERLKSELKPGKQIERTVDLGDKVEYIYTDGTRETKPKGASPGGLGPSGQGMSQFAGIQNGKAVIFKPSRGGGSLATVDLPGEGPIVSKTETFEEARAVNNAKSGLKAAATVRSMLADKNILAQAAIPGSPGARKFAAARKEMVDVLTRLRTGAALNREEETFYAGQAPTLLDLTDPEAIEYKLKMFEDLYSGIANRRAAPAAGGGAPQAGPKTAEEYLKTLGK